MASRIREEWSQSVGVFEVGGVGLGLEGGGFRERAIREKFENMDCKEKHLQCISGIFDFSRGGGGGSAGELL